MGEVIPAKGQSKKWRKPVKCPQKSFLGKLGEALILLKKLRIVNDSSEKVSLLSYQMDGMWTD
jgi:hypothetical protein